MIGETLPRTGAVDEGSLAVTCPGYLLISLAIVIRRQHPVRME